MGALMGTSGNLKTGKSLGWRGTTTMTWQLCHYFQMLDCVWLQRRSHQQAAHRPLLYMSWLTRSEDDSKQDLLNSQKAAGSSKDKENKWGDIGSGHDMCRPFFFWVRIFAGELFYLPVLLWTQSPTWAILPAGLTPAAALDWCCRPCAHSQHPEQPGAMPRPHAHPMLS